MIHQAEYALVSLIMEKYSGSKLAEHHADSEAAIGQSTSLNIPVCQHDLSLSTCCVVSCSSHTCSVGVTRTESGVLEADCAVADKCKARVVGKLGVVHREAVW